MTTRSLSFHANYGCRHTGVCCTSDWPIPVEADLLADAERAIAGGRLRMAAAAPQPFVRVEGAPPETPAVVATAGGACIFYRGGMAPGAAEPGRCLWHQTLGHGALPLACRQFPRVCLTDPRGTSVTLSHYCPTAASLLETPGDIRIVIDPTAFPPAGEYVGLDARSSLPPLLRPDMLMGWEDWWEWEARTVSLIAEAPDVDAALDGLASAVECARSWSPVDGPLGSRVDEAFARAAETMEQSRTMPVPSAAAARRRRQRSARRVDVIGSIPPELRPKEPMLLGGAASPTAHRRFLLAHAFGNWTAQLGQGLRSWLRSLEAADALVAMGAGVRHADLLLRHLADSFELARRWSAAEHSPPGLS
jgi:hypothetical protein